MAFDVYLTVGANIAHADSINLNDPANGLKVFGRTIDLSTPGLIRFTLGVTKSTADARIAAAATIFRLIRRAAQAERIGSGITCSIRAAGTEWNHFDLTGFAADPELAIRIDPSGTSAEYDLALSCYPYPRGDAISVTGDISGTKAGSTAAFLVDAIPGTVDALAHLELTDTSGSGVINRVRVGLIRGDFTAATDYTPWVDMIADGGVATDATVSGALGGEAADITLTSTSHAAIARGVQPAGSRARGRFDAFLRVSGTGTAIGTPANLAGVANAPTINSTMTSGYGAPYVRQVAFDRISGTGTATATLNGVLEGSLLAFVSIRNGTGTFSSLTDPSDYQVVATVGLSAGITQDSMAMRLYQRRNVAAGTHAVSTTMSIAGQVTNVALLEIANADLIIASDDDGSDTDVTTITPTVTPANTEFPSEAVLALIAHGTDASTDDITDFWFNGYEPVTSDNQFVFGIRGMDSRGETPPGPSVRVTSSVTSWVAITANIKPKRIENSTTEYVEPTPGELDAGTYTIRAQVIDAAGYRGNASASITPSVTTDRSSIDLSWDAVTNATAYVLTIGYSSRFYEVITTGTSYELETLDGLREVAALPSTSGATAPAPRIRALVGTENDHTMTALPEVALSGSGAFELVRLFSNRQLPPIDAPLSDTWADYAVEVQGRSANGRNAAVQVDALWIVPCREPQAEAWIQGLAEATKRRWVMESHRSGKGVFGWLEATAGGAEVGRLTTAGALLIPPGTSIVLLAFQQAADVHTFGAQVTATLTIWPRSRWELDT
jgi:hypothetical protein